MIKEKAWLTIFHGLVDHPIGALITGCLIAFYSAFGNVQFLPVGAALTICSSSPNLDNAISGHTVVDHKSNISFCLPRSLSLRIRVDIRDLGSTSTYVNEQLVLIFLISEFTIIYNKPIDYLR